MKIELTFNDLWECYLSMFKEHEFDIDEFGNIYDYFEDTCEDMELLEIIDVLRCQVSKVEKSDLMKEYDATDETDLMDRLDENGIYYFGSTDGKSIIMIE